MFKILFGLMLLSITLLMSQVITVNTLVDENVTNGKCSLREAIVEANTNSGEGDCNNKGNTGIDIIEIEPIGTMQLIATLPSIYESVKIIGKGVDKLRITGLQYHPDPLQLKGIFIFQGGGFGNEGGHSSIQTYELKGMQLYYGLNQTNGVLSEKGEGGSISVSKYVDFTLDHVDISWSTAEDYGGGISFRLNSPGAGPRNKIKILWSTFYKNNSIFGGGGMHIVGDTDVIIKYSTFYANIGGNLGSVHNIGRGGGIFMTTRSMTGSSLVIENCTIVGNAISGREGGALWLSNGYLNTGTHNYPFDVNISHSTIAYNSATLGFALPFAEGGPAHCAGEGAGISVRDVGVALRLENSVVYGNKDIDYERMGCPVGRDIHMKIGLPFNGTTGGQNWIGNVAVLSNINNVFEITGSPNAQGDFINQGDPGIRDPYASVGTNLINHGGPTRTMPPLDTSSPLFIYAKPCSATMDQRGFARDPYCHIGAAQLGSYPIFDYDGDGTIDEDDIFPLDPLEWLDTDNDNLGNNVDSDDDNDGVSDDDEIALGFNPLDANSTPLDTDNDGLFDILDTDDDNDGISDIDEIALGFNPLDVNSTPVDTDGDGSPDALDSDDDNDGISDSDEVSLGFNPLNASDGLADSDGDGFSNAMEFNVGTNMNDANDKPIWAPIMMGDIMMFVPTKM